MALKDDKSSCHGMKEGRDAQGHDQGANANQPPPVEQPPCPAADLGDAGKDDEEKAEGQDQQTGGCHDADAFIDRPALNCRITREDIMVAEVYRMDGRDIAKGYGLSQAEYSPNKRDRHCQQDGKKERRRRRSTRRERHQC